MRGVRPMTEDSVCSQLVGQLHPYLVVTSIEACVDG